MRPAMMAIKTRTTAAPRFAIQLAAEMVCSVGKKTVMTATQMTKTLAPQPAK